MNPIKFYRVETLPEVGEVGSLYFVYGSGGEQARLCLCVGNGLFETYTSEHQDISGKVDVADFEEATKVTSATLNFFHSNTLWQTEDTYVKCDKSKTLEGAISGESDIVYFTTDSHQIILNGVVYSLLDISGKVDVTDFEEYKLAISATINTLNLNLAAKESDILLLLAQVLELQNLISTLMG